MLRIPLRLKSSCSHVIYKHDPRADSYKEPSNRMKKSILFALLIYLTRTVHSNDDDTTTTTTVNETNHRKLDDLGLVATLAYNKSGNINALSWSFDETSTASNTTEHYRQFYLVAASVTTFQVWNEIELSNNQSDASTKWNIEQLIPSRNIAHAVAFSPNRKWLALGKHFLCSSNSIQKRVLNLSFSHVIYL